MMRGSLLVAAAVVAAASSSSSWLDSHKALVRGRTRGAWAALLANYSAVQRAQRRRDDGLYVVAFADNYGLGNRVDTVVSSLALAMRTGRALAVRWPRQDCSKHLGHNKPDCAFRRRPTSRERTISPPVRNSLETPPIARERTPISPPSRRRRSRFETLAPFRPRRPDGHPGPL